MTIRPLIMCETHHYQPTAWVCTHVATCRTKQANRRNIEDEVAECDDWICPVCEKAMDQGKKIRLQAVCMDCARLLLAGVDMEEA